MSRMNTFTQDQRPTNRNLQIAWLIVVLPVSLLTFTMSTQGQQTGGTDAGSVLDKLPAGWKRVREIEIAPAQLQAIGRKLGGKIVKGKNAFFESDGATVQINTLICSSIASATKIHDALVKLKSNSRLVCQQETLVYELVATTPEQMRLANRARYELGLQPEKVTYQVKFQAAPLATTGDWMAFNVMFNHFLQYDQKKKSGASTEQQENAIKKLAPKFDFTNQTEVRSMGQGDFRTVWKVDPQAKSMLANEAGDLTTLHFDKLPEKVGLPVVTLEGRITSQTYAITPIVALDTRTFLAATDRFPANDAKIKQLATKITANCKTREEKTRAILDWLQPGKNLDYGGKITGSRYGTLQVLEQKFGHCWDFSDVFVTLCRASDVPARQVTGWLYGVSGHVWAEVLVDGQGWQAVDPSAGLRCGSDYIPLMASADGEIALLYLSDIMIEVVSSDR